MTAHKPGDPTTLNRLYGRSQGKPLRAGQQALVDTLLPQIAVPVEGEVSSTTLFGDAKGQERPLHFEIGFGGGEHLAQQAARNPDVTIIGCEPFLNGVGSVLRHVEDGGLDNVLILADDARPLLARLPDAALARIFILFADPWPKARHNKRRFIQTETVAEFARVLKPGGIARFATDWADYADWALERFLANPDFIWEAQAPEDWTQPPADHVTTRYETKGLGDCKPVFFDFARR